MSTQSSSQGNLKINNHLNEFWILFLTNLAILSPQNSPQNNDNLNKQSCLNEKTLEANRICNEIEHHHNHSQNDYFQQEALEKLIQESSINIQRKNEIKLETCEKKTNNSNDNKTKTNNWISVDCSLKKDDDGSTDNIERKKLEKDTKNSIDTIKQDNKSSLRETVEYMKNKENGTIETVSENSIINQYENDKTISIKINQSTKSANNEIEDNTSEMINNEKLSPHKLKKLVSNSAFKDYNNPQLNKNLFDVNISTFDSENLFNSENGGVSVKIFHSAQ